MGEAGPEAIMPLSRDPSGKLGVAVQGAAAPAPASKTQQVSIGGTNLTVQGSADGATISQMKRMLDDRDRAILKRIEDSWRTAG